MCSSKFCVQKNLNCAVEILWFSRSVMCVFLVVVVCVCVCVCERERERERNNCAKEILWLV